MSKAVAWLLVKHIAVVLQLLNLKCKLLSFDREACGTAESIQIVAPFSFSAPIRLRNDVQRCVPGCVELESRLCQKDCKVHEALLPCILQLGDHGLACPRSNFFIWRASKDAMSVLFQPMY